MDLREYLKVLRRRKRAIVVALVACLASYLVLLLRTPARYTSTAAILLEAPPFEEQFLSKQFRNAFLVAKAIDLQTQLRIMTSTPALEKISRKLSQEGYQVSPEEIQGAAEVTRDDMSPVIYVNATSNEKEKAEKIAQAFVEVAVEENRNFAVSSYNDAIEFAQKSLLRYKKQAESIARRIQAFNMQHGVIDFSQEVQGRIARVGELAAKLEDAKLAERELAAQKDELQKRLQQVPAWEKRREKAPNPKMQAYRSRLVELELQKESLSQQYTPDHPKMVALERLQKSLLEKMATEVSREVEIETEVPSPYFQQLRQSWVELQLGQVGTSVRQEVLGRILAQESDYLRALSKEQVTYASLLEEKQKIETLLDGVRALKDELEINRVTQGNAKILNPASKASAAPRTSGFQLLMVVAMSLFLSVGLGTVVELLDDTVRTPFAVRRYLSLPIIGTVPFIKAAEDRSLSQLFPKSPAAEPYHRIAFKLHQAAIKHRATTLAFTSARPQELKTSVVINTGIALAWGGHEVILVDTDFRRPSLHRAFDLSNSIGLSSLLSGELEAEKELADLESEAPRRVSLEEQLEEVLLPTPVNGLTLLPAGPPQANPIHLLQSNRFREVARLLKETNKLVLFDTPPVFVVTDAMVTLSQLEAGVMVINSASTKKAEVQYAKTQMEASGKPILGVILTMQDPREELTYYGYYGRDGRFR